MSLLKAYTRSLWLTHLPSWWPHSVPPPGFIARLDCLSEVSSQLHDMILEGWRERKISSLPTLPLLSRVTELSSTALHLVFARIFFPSRNIPQKLFCGPLLSPFGTSLRHLSPVSPATSLSQVQKLGCWVQPILPPARIY